MNSMNANAVLFHVSSGGIVHSIVALMHSLHVQATQRAFYLFRDYKALRHYMYLVTL